MFYLRSYLNSYSFSYSPIVRALILIATVLLVEALARNATTSIGIGIGIGIGSGSGTGDRIGT